MSNADENKVDKKSESEKPCTVAIDIPPSMYLRHMDNLTPGKYDGTGEGGVLVTHNRMTDSDADKVDAIAKVDAPGASCSSKYRHSQDQCEESDSKPRAPFTICTVSTRVFETAGPP